MSQSGVYQIENQQNGNRYIGSAVSIRTRWAIHLSMLRRNTHRNRHLQAAFNKYGEPVFDFRVLEHTETANLIEREQHYLDTLKPEYNIALRAGMPMLGRHHTTQTRSKMSEAQRGERGNIYGKHPTEETRAKLRAVWTPERRQKASDRATGERNANFGKFGEEHPAYGRHHSEETKRKMREAHKGRLPISAETRTKLSEAHRGKKRKPLSEGHRRKLSEAGKAYWRRVHAAESGKAQV